MILKGNKDILYSCLFPIICIVAVLEQVFNKCLKVLTEWTVIAFAKPSTNISSDYLESVVWLCQLGSPCES